jgi:prepilin-type N-terminal cleavage/methylation domain-containing protein
MKTDQKGFSVVEVLVVLVILGLLGAVGWLVFDRQKNKPAPVTSTTQKTTDQKEQTGTTDTKTSQQQFLEVKEWGVKVPLSSEISDLSYEVTTKSLNLHDKTQPVVKFYTARLQAAKGICSENTFPVSLNRGIASDIPIMGDGPGPDDVTANSYGSLYEKNAIKPDGGNINVGLIKVGTYYYTDAMFPGAECSNYNNTAAEQARSAEPKSAIVTALKAMQPL